MDDTRELEKATFAAGCLWGIEAAFRQIKGVVDTIVGYTGGSVPEPDHKEVRSGRTRHAETVGILFDPNEVSYEKLLDTFWCIHDPTQVNEQGPDVGPSYRSAIFYHSPEQTEASKARLVASEKYRGRTIATGIVPASQFWKAEEYPQQYYEECGRGYCAIKKCWE